MKRFLLMASMAALLGLAGTPAQAGMVAWSYSFEPSTTNVYAQASSGTALPGSISFTNPAGAESGTSNNVVLANLQQMPGSSGVTYSYDSANPAYNGAWSVAMTLTDTASGLSHTFVFTGNLGGDFASNSIGGVTNTFTGQTTQSATIGGNVYTVGLNSFISPPAYNPTNSTPPVGGIGALVTVNGGSLGGGGTSGTGTPEPSTLLLSCFGLGFAGLASWRQRRRRTLAARLA